LEAGRAFKILVDFQPIDYASGITLGGMAAAV